jgi:hypothetical protein
MSGTIGKTARSLLVGLALAFAFAGPAGAGAVPGGMSVDYVNRSQGLVSVRIPDGVKVDAAMNFAVLDPENRTVAVVFPAEITPRLFWSGALEPDVIGLVKEGMAVARTELSPAEASRIRDAARARAASLQQEERLYRRDKIQRQIAQLESQIRSLRDDDARFNVAQQGIAVEKVQDVRNVFEGSNDLQTRIDLDFARQGELARRRSDLADQVASLYTRPAPPQGEIAVLNGQIRAVDGETDRINTEILRFQKEQRDLTEKALAADEKRARSDLDREELRYRILKLEEELTGLKAELSRL